MLRERGMVDLQLLVGGLLLGTLLGLWAGRYTSANPGTRRTRLIHGVTAVLMSCPPYFLAFVVLWYFAWNSGEFALPFVSGQGDYVPFSEDPLRMREGDLGAVGARRAAARRRSSRA